MADEHHLSQLKLPYLKRLAEKLDPKTTIGHDWRDVADGLGFSMDSIRHVESMTQGCSPTLQVLNQASHKAGVTVGSLREVFHTVERHDCICILDEAAEEVAASPQRKPSPSAVEHDDRYHPVSLPSGGEASLAQRQNGSLRSVPVESEDTPDDGHGSNSQEDVWVRQQPAPDRNWQHVPQGADSNVPFSSAAMSISQNHSMNGMDSGLSARGQNASMVDRSVTSGMLTLNIAGQENDSMQCGEQQRSNVEGGVQTNGESAGPHSAFSERREPRSTSFDDETESVPSPASYPYSPSSRGDQGLSTDMLTTSEESHHNQSNLPPIRSFMSDDNPRTLTSNDFFPLNQQYPNGQQYNMAMGPQQYNPAGMNGYQNACWNGGARPRGGYGAPRMPYGRGIPQYNGAASGGRGHPYVPHDQPMRVPPHPSQPLMNGPYRPNTPLYPMYNSNGYPPPPCGPLNSVSQKQHAQNAATGPSSESGMSSAPDSFRASGSNTGTSRNESGPPPQMARAMSMPPNAAPGLMAGIPGGAVMQNGVPAVNCTRSLSVNYPPIAPDPIPATSERIFITYSQDNEVHLMRVLDMAKKLFAEGFFVEVDMFARHFAGIDKMGWLDGRIKKAAFVIIICSPQYMADVEKESDGTSEAGLNTLYIHRSLQTEYLDNRACNYRFIPILFDGFSRECVPRWLHNTTIFYWPKDIQDIMARLRRRERFVTPAIGKPPCIRRNPDHT
ncbi:uncharacterized protein [Branchiostoma lanceolatum]|uniref:uncharacterized protein n=1 Tax=Branchiostoma lanceolatum TaxID=7740 RepID=UPI003452BB1B